MRALRRFKAMLFVATTLLAGAAVPATAQQQPQQHQHMQPAGLIGDLISDLEQAEKKFLDLARAIPEEKFSWRPTAGVRSVTEVLLHVASDNYFIPALGGVAAPAETGIKSDDYKTTVAYEKRMMDKATAITALEQSFAHVKKAMAETPESRFDEPVPMLGPQGSLRRLWLLEAMHVHEHLGQLIAYARVNGVVPPWSQSGG